MGAGPLSEACAAASFKARSAAAPLRASPVRTVEAVGLAASGLAEARRSSENSLVSEVGQALSAPAMWIARLAHLWEMG